MIGAETISREVIAAVAGGLGATSLIVGMVVFAARAAKANRRGEDMKRYVLIESRDPFEDPDGEWYRRLAVDLKTVGRKVSVFLVENAVFAVRKNAQGEFLDVLAANAVEVYADEFALRERGVGADEVAAGVITSNVDYIVDQMADGASVIWR